MLKNILIIAFICAGFSISLFFLVGTLQNWYAAKLNKKNLEKVDEDNDDNDPADWWKKEK